MTDEQQDDAPVRVYVDLIGDLFHWGDARLLERARATGDLLVVGVIGDADAEAASHRPVMTLAERVAVIAACRHVDEVVPAAPLAPDDAFLDRYRIDRICLTDDFGHAARQEAFAALLDGDRAVVLPVEKDISTGDIVQRIVGRTDGLPAARPLATGPVLHGAAEAELRDGLAQLAAGQDALLRAVGALAAERFGSPFLLRERAPALSDWASIAANLAAEALARARPSRDDLAQVSGHLARLRAALGEGRRIALIGDQAVPVGYALAAEPALSVTVLQPGASATVPPEARAPLPNLRIAACDGWQGLPAVLPPVDLLGVLDIHAGSFLLGAPLVLWHLAERIGEGLLIGVSLAVEAADVWRPRADGSGFVYSDAAVRGMLHDARLFEVADVATVVDGVPHAPVPRVSRFTYREGIAHGRKFRYLDGAPARGVDLPVGARIQRWYVGRKGPLTSAEGG